MIHDFSSFNEARFDAYDMASKLTNALYSENNEDFLNEIEELKTIYDNVDSKKQKKIVESILFNINLIKPDFKNHPHWAIKILENFDFSENVAVGMAGVTDVTFVKEFIKMYNFSARRWISFFDNHITDIHGNSKDFLEEIMPFLDSNEVEIPDESLEFVKNNYQNYPNYSIVKPLLEVPSRIRQSAKSDQELGDAVKSFKDFGMFDLVRKSN